MRTRLGARRAAVRARRARLVVTVDRMGGHGRGPGHRPRDARLVRGRLGRDDGRDDVSVGLADGRAILAHEPTRAASAARSSRAATFVAWTAAGVLAFAVSDLGGACSAADSRGIVAAAGSPEASWSSLPSTSSPRSRTSAWGSAAARSASWSAPGATARRAHCRWVFGTAPGASAVAGR